MADISTEVLIRVATLDDLPALEWDGEFAHFRRLYQDVYQSSRRGEAVLWVVEVPGVGVVGQAFVQLSSARMELANGSTRAYVYGFRIQPAYRSQGIGTRLLQRVEADLFGRGFRRVVLNVSRENHSARRLYERLGYRVVAAEPGRWSYLDQFGRRQEVDEPAWRMEKPLQ
jgi:ribosomal protein S18 acetylase RimI-like enzyme